MGVLPRTSVHLVDIQKMLEMIQKICDRRGISLATAAFECGLGRTFYSKLVYRHSMSINSDSFVSTTMWLLQYSDDPSVSVQSIWDELVKEREE